MRPPSAPIVTTPCRGAPTVCSIAFRAAVGVAADEIGATVDDHLRRVDALGAEPRLIGLLAAGERRGRKAILPAELIPVVDVLAEADDCAPAIGCVAINLSSSVSAGGQSEHPSDVKSSTITGVARRRGPAGGAGRGRRRCRSRSRPPKHRASHRSYSSRHDSLMCAELKLGEPRKFKIMNFSDPATGLHLSAIDQLFKSTAQYHLEPIAYALSKKFRFDVRSGTSSAPGHGHEEAQ